ncbi:hemin uptake protein HemP [Planctomycetes bacterium K23_9]|uniref:Hemin uptake protein hemP n=1 Tax=Stieleria marina TaxID=1930275 RepID=A0A517P0P0_9BACT|nr:Hemin uptake protein hemP [Planctomycetes bacterium K23_9]
MASHDESRTDQPDATVGGPPTLNADGAKVINFEDLARCGNEVWIRNGGQLYRLQQTRQGKLILTK